MRYKTKKTYHIVPINYIHVLWLYFVSKKSTTWPQLTRKLRRSGQQQKMAGGWECCLLGASGRHSPRRWPSHEHTCFKSHKNPQKGGKHYYLPVHSMRNCVSLRNFVLRLVEKWPIFYTARTKLTLHHAIPAWASWFLPNTSFQKLVVDWLCDFRQRSDDLSKIVLHPGPFRARALWNTGIGFNTLARVPFWIRGRPERRENGLMYSFQFAIKLYVEGYTSPNLAEL